jgi:PAS domain-containing protein
VDDPQERGPAAFAGDLARLGERLAAVADMDAASPEAGELHVELATAYEELQVAGEELRAQQDELAQLAHARRLARWQHERLLALLPVPVLVTDTRGLIISANAPAAAALGGRVNRILRKPLAAFVDTGDRGEFRTVLSQALAAEGASIHAPSLTFRRPDTDQSAATELLVVAGPADGAAEEVTWMLVGTGDPADRSGQVRRPKGFARALVDLAALPLHRAQDRKILDEAVRICQRGLGNGYTVSLVVGAPLEPDLVASGGDFAQQLDGAQVIAAEGPCLDAYTTGESVVWSRPQQDERWPRLAAALDAVPVRGIRAAPVAIGEQPAGVLNVYSSEHDLADASVAELVCLLGNAVGAVLHEIAAKSELETLAGQLETALESRATIEQAKGIVMAIQHCGPDEAFDHLQKISNDTNTKLREVANDTVRSALTGIAGEETA